MLAASFPNMKASHSDQETLVRPMVARPVLRFGGKPPFICETIEGKVIQLFNIHIEKHIPTKGTSRC
jgi:hypothetical protein